MANAETGNNGAMTPNFDIPFEFNADQVTKAAEEIIRHTWNGTYDTSTAEDPARGSECTENDSATCNEPKPECTGQAAATCEEGPSEPQGYCHITQQEGSCPDGTCDPRLCE